MNSILECRLYYHTEDWGFYAHKLLNRLAVFTLPEAMMGFYKSNIEFLEEHAVDPDKRRYAIKGEAIRHYIDLDKWGGLSAIKTLPRIYEESILKYSRIFIIDQGDTTQIFEPVEDSIYSFEQLKFTKDFQLKHTLFKSEMNKSELLLWMKKYAMPHYDDKNWIIPSEATKALMPTTFQSEDKILIIDRFSSHGIIPYSFEQFYHRLVNAFKEKNSDKILKLSADIGHYVGDAHVPLHTTENYNGQLTNQDGIHAFWESRIPELFAESDFDFVVGQALYIDNIREFIWSSIGQAHQYVDSVLIIEKRISHQVASDKQYCFETRAGIVSKLPCKDYAALYNAKLDNQVENQFRKCILAIGSIWMSAWTDAGQPNLKNLNSNRFLNEYNAFDSIQNSNSKTPYFIRDHE